MLPIENKIIFTDGDYEAPYISKVIEVMTNSATRFELAKEVIFNVETGRQGLREAARIVENTLGEGSVIYYNSQLDGAYEWTNRKRKGKNRRAVIERYQRLQNGRGNAQRFIDSSNALYVDSNKKRVTNWNKRTGLLLPVGISIDNSANSISQNAKNVNDDIQFSLRGEKVSSNTLAKFPLCAKIISVML